MFFDECKAFTTNFSSINVQVPDFTFDILFAKPLSQGQVDELFMLACHMPTYRVPKQRFDNVNRKSFVDISDQGVQGVLVNSLQHFGCNHECVELWFNANHGQPNVLLLLEPIPQFAELSFHSPGCHVPGQWCHQHVSQDYKERSILVPKIPKIATRCRFSATIVKLEF